MSRIWKWDRPARRPAVRMVGAEEGSSYGSACDTKSLLGGPGDDLLSRVLGRSTIGAEGFHGRVRDGIGCGTLAMATRPSQQGLSCLRVCRRMGIGRLFERARAIRTG